MGHDSVIKMLIRKHVHGVRERERGRARDKRKRVYQSMYRTAAFCFFVPFAPACGVAIYIYIQ